MRDSNNMRGAAKKNVLYINLADQILEYIRSNNIQKGERIPSERRLAELFSASRASIREAVRILEYQGFVEIQIGNGMYLKTDSKDQKCCIELWKIDYTELLEIKTLLEFQIISYLCANMTDAEYRYLEEPLRTLEADYEKGVFSILEDGKFHTRIRNLYPNKTMVQLLDNLIEELDIYGRRTNCFQRFWLTTIPYHRELLEAMKAHDIEKVRTAYDKIYELDKCGLKISNQLNDAAL